ncbi:MULTISPECIES: hydroxyethylthiazole kinase [unclassified Methanoculleus]|uniref:hydroxyethylthiazole kinase n=1 Tax=unclassified Methanoculleus TaxID=2619537 RepID=UPI0025F68DF0|nr:MULTISPECIES: hydroxyethylthiazole kinase [unclassified Methanoculleus]
MPNTTEGSSARFMDGAIPAGLLAAVRSERPLIHHITNSVTINDCANITISTGAAPVMAEAPEEVAEMVAGAGALVLNIGTLSAAQVDAMLIAGRRANDLGIPVVLDPVGAGATEFRTATAKRLLDTLDIAVLKGNAGEIGVLAGTGGNVRGVDSGGVKGDPIETARECARATGTVVAMTGAVDVVTDGTHVYLVGNGNPAMDRLSGTGCMVASVTAAFVAVGDDRAVASAAALAAFGRAGERAAAGGFAGPYTFRTALFDELAGLSPGDLAGHARIEER